MPLVVLRLRCESGDHLATLKSCWRAYVCISTERLHQYSPVALADMEYVKSYVKGLASSLGAGDMDMRQLLTQGVNLGVHDTVGSTHSIIVL